MSVLRSDVAKIRARLAALRAMTVDRGCTEAEAAAAAEKAAEMLAAHSLTEAELEAPSFEEIDVRLRGRRTALDTIWPTVAVFADCAGFLRRREGSWSFVYFGRDGDVLIAEYVHEVVARAAVDAQIAFRRSEGYQRRRKAKTRLRAMKAFLEGFAETMRRRLRQGLWKRLEPQAADPNALVEHRQALLWQHLNASGRFGTTQSIARATGRFRDSARIAGAAQAAKVTIDAAVAGAAPIAGLLR